MPIQFDQSRYVRLATTVQEAVHATLQEIAEDDLQAVLCMSGEDLVDIIKYYAEHNFNHQKYPEAEFDQVVDAVARVLENKSNAFLKDLYAELTRPYRNLRSHAAVREAGDSGHLTPSSRRVLDAFIREEPAENKWMVSDGVTLEKLGLGGMQLAYWRDGHLFLVGINDSRSSQAFLRYLRRKTPRNLLIDNSR